MGVRTVMDELMEATRDKDSGVRKAAVSLLFAFCCQTKADYTQYIPQLIRGLIHLFTDEDPQVLKLSWDALNAVIKVTFILIILFLFLSLFANISRFFHTFLRL